MKIELGRVQLFDPPQSHERLLRRLGGLAWNGLPRLRLVWGWKRLALMGGVYEQDTGIVNPRTGQEETVPRARHLSLEPKYYNPDMWFLEKWVPPASFGPPYIWRNLNPEVVPSGCIDFPAGTVVEALGPYPCRGDYEAIFGFEFLPNLYCLETAVGAHEVMSEVQRKLTVEQRIQEKVDEMAVRRKEHDADFDEKWDQFQPALHGNPFVSVPGSYNPARGKATV